MEPLISIIVPVYRVEKYLKKCVDSLLTQTYKNIEIVLVDDGSDDGSPAICDTYMRDNQCVICLHKRNGGLSEARNYGLEHAKGKYITFVDSDDYVEETYIQDLWMALINGNADMAIGGAIVETESHKKIKIIGSNANLCLSCEDAFEKVCYGVDLSIYAWGKLFKRNSLIKHLFPVGKIHEDVWTIPFIIADCQKIAVSSKKNYHYVQREGSILHKGFNERFYDAIDGSFNIIEYANKYVPQNINAAYGRLLIESNAILHRAVQDPNFEIVRQKIISNFAGKWKWVVCERNIPFLIRLQMILCRLDSRLYRYIYKIFKKL